MFKPLEGDQVMLSKKGVHSVHDLYTWQGKLFAKVGSGFIRLKTDGSTTGLDLKIVHMEFEGQLYKDRFGRLCTEENDQRQPIPMDNWLMIGAPDD